MIDKLETEGQEKQFEPIPQEEIDAAKDVNLVELAKRYVQLERWSTGEVAGPCPKCSGKDRFHVRKNWFCCYQCYPPKHKSAHDPIDFIRWVENINFREAVGILNRKEYREIKNRRTPEYKEKPKQHEWKSAKWQREVKAMLEDAQDRLWNRPDGERGRVYLEERGFLSKSQDMILAFGLGFAHVWHPKHKEKRPAILLPWQGMKSVTAVQYRFTDSDLKKSERFSQKGGGERLLFGLHLLKHTDANTLILCEGELNAVSLLQVCYENYPIHVLSWGSQDNIGSGVVDLANKIAPKYKRIIIWADEPDRAVDAMNALSVPHVLPIKSPQGKDANDLLKAGLLESFLVRLMIRHYQRHELKRENDEGLYLMAD